MRRRDFLLKGVAAVGSYTTSSLLAQPAPPIKRAAIVIGVNKTGQMPILRAAASGARGVADWFVGQGFDYVKAITDETGPVRRGAIFREISKLTKAATVEQLVVFFAGHGLLKERDEIWLLSDAPTDGNEAIRVVESGQLARETTAIPHVVFISDACRTIPTTRAHLWTHGGTIFPNERASAHERPNVDHFWATRIGHASYEGPLTDEVSRVVGYYTECFLDAFRKPHADLVSKIGNGYRIVTNMNLQEYLHRELPGRVAALSILRNQVPDAWIMSGTFSYIGRLSQEITPRPGLVGARVPSLRDAAAVSFNKNGLGYFSSSPSNVLGNVPGSLADQEFGRAYEMVSVARARPTGFRGSGEAETGFTVSGLPLMAAVSDQNVKVGRPVQEGSIAVDLGDRSSGLVALQFANGTGTILPALKGYVGHILIDSGGVADVSYVGAHPEPDDVRRLRAAVATSAKLGVFRIEGERSYRLARAYEFERRFKSLGRFDPSLALYAGYAYDQADVAESVRSLALSMVESLKGVALFDIAMLAGLQRTRSRAKITPFCPMLTQGWGLLRVKNVSLGPELEQARVHLLHGLWTTFSAEGMAIVTQLVRKGAAG